MELAPPRGTADLYPPRSEALLALEEDAHRVARLFGYRYVETPAFEHTDVFARTAGASSDIVTKEMYTFVDKGGRSLTLRPEGTAPIVRLFLEHEHDLPSPWKAYYVELNWRHDRPQAGRYREFRQFGVEVIGSAAPAADVEVIAVADRFLREGGLADVTLLLNSIGDEVCRPAYRLLLLRYLRAHEDELGEECRERIDVNPLRTFDCKKPRCRRVMEGAPLIADHLCDPCTRHYADVRDGLEAEGIAYRLDPRLVRGLDYYTRTTFEFASAVLASSQSGLGGGGRYDGLAEQLGGTATPGIGFAMGLERILLAMEGEGVAAVSAGGPRCFVVALGSEAAVAGRDLLRTLRDAGVSSAGSFDERSMKAQLRMADRAGAGFAAILGERELAERCVTLRRLSDGSQDQVPLDEVAAWLTAEGAEAS
jgi:histidyl-tRNA synthetase